MQMMDSPPEPSRPSPNATPLSELLRSAAAGTLLVLFGLRLALAVMGVPDWTVSWEVIAVATLPASWIVSQIPGFDVPIIQRMTASDATLFLIAVTIATYLLATLTVRRAAHTPG